MKTVIALVVMMAASTQAATYCVRAGAGGDGSSWSSAYSDIPSRQVAGATYYLAAGTYGSLVVSSDGVTGLRVADASC